MHVSQDAVVLTRWFPKAFRGALPSDSNAEAEKERRCDDRDDRRWGGGDPYAAFVV